MQYPAIVVANELIKLANFDKFPLTPMKLQKILYLSNGLSYKKQDDKLINEKFEAWDYGPVVPTVYNAFKQYGRNNITKPFDELLHANGYGFVDPLSIPIKDEDIDIIREAWRNTKDLSAFTLSAWSHNKNSPWDKAYNAKPKQLYISDDEMKKYFIDFFKEA